MPRKPKEGLGAPPFLAMEANGTFKPRPDSKNGQFERNPGQERAIPILSDTKYDEYLLYGGARAGKTRLLVYLIFCRALKAPGSRHVILRKHFIDAKQSLGMDTIAKVIRDHFPGLGITCNKSDWFWKLPNGAEVWIGGLDDGDRVEKILGKEFATIYFNEASEVDYDAFTTVRTRLAQRCECANGSLLRTVIYLDENPSSVRHWTYLRYVQGIDPESKAKLPESVTASLGVCRLDPKDNEGNLSPAFLRSLEGLPRAKRMRYLLGEFSSDTEGALWKAGWIDDARKPEFSWGKLGRIVVAVDPAVTSSKKSDYTGIVVAGILNGEPSHYYVLEDASGKYTPLEWGRKAVDLFERYQADCIVGESNQGGDLVEANIHRISEFSRVKLVHATRGKWIRAEPIAALYERGLVHHVGEFPDLESEMTTWKPDDADSPDRMDALVWGITELSGGGTLRVVDVGQFDPENQKMELALEAQRRTEIRIEAMQASSPLQPVDEWSQSILRDLDDGI